MGFGYRWRLNFTNTCCLGLWTLIDHPKISHPRIGVDKGVNMKMIEVTFLLDIMRIQKETYSKKETLTRVFRTKKINIVSILRYPYF